MSTPYDEGRTACSLGASYGANPYPPSANCRAWNEGWKDESHQQAEREKSNEADQRLRNVVDAFEAFIDAKISDIQCLRGAPDGVNETREHLADKLAEWLAEK